MRTAAIILAAGKGTRMSSDLPKVLHDVAGRPLVSYVIDAIRPISGERIYLVVGYRADDVIEACRKDGVQFVMQEQQLGTGHAVQQCEAALADFDGTVVVLNGDVPCLRSETVAEFIAFHVAEGAAATVLTARLHNPTGYGRIVRGDDGALLGIVEEKDADEATKQVDEINSGLFCFDKARLFQALRSTDTQNAQDEYYLTDVIAVLHSQGEAVRAYCIDDSSEVAGVNTDDELEEIQRRIKG